LTTTHRLRALLGLGTSRAERKGGGGVSGVSGAAKQQSGVCRWCATDGAAACFVWLKIGSLTAASRFCAATSRSAAATALDSSNSRSSFSAI
jgi:hypothetical protein